MKRTLVFRRVNLSSSNRTPPPPPRRRRHHSTDAALLWGRDHPEAAQACLQPPPFVTSSTSFINMPQNWSEFWKWRNWNFSSSSSSSSRKHEEALVSHVLSGPLTLAHAKHDVQHWTCLGARAESMLPAPYWNEFLYHDYHHHPSHPSNCNETTRHTSLSFVGPECDHVPSQQQLTWKNHTLTLQWSFRGKYHEMPSHDTTTATTTTTSNGHGFVMFHPGLAHAHLQKDWRPTLEMLWKVPSGKRHSFLLTAHSAADAERDWKLWHAYDSTIPLYQENPWASPITYQDPLDPTIRIRPNLYVCHHVME